MSNPQIEVFSTCPQFRIEEADHFPGRVAEVARWSEVCGCKGILVYSDNSQLDPSPCSVASRCLAGAQSSGDRKRLGPA